MRQQSLAGVVLLGSLGPWCLSTEALATLVGDQLTISSFARPGGAPVTVVDPGVEYDFVALNFERDRVDIGPSGFTTTIITPNIFAFGGAATGDIFTLSGVDFADDPAGKVIQDVRFTSPHNSSGVSVANLIFSDGPGVDSGEISFEIVTGGTMPTSTNLAWSFEILDELPADRVIMSNSNIFGSGHAAAPGSGVVPRAIDLPAGSDRTLTFGSVTGTVSCCNGDVANGPDGRVFGGTDINSSGGISGIRHTAKRFFLTGVFLDDTEPTNPAPPRLDFSGLGGDSFAELSPVLNQTFYIGDGLTGTGSGDPQQFHVPDGATRLFLGYVDGGNYNNNTGFFQVAFDVAVPPVLLPGDANNDGLVSGLDLIAVQEGFGDSEPGEPTGLLKGDANDDGLVSGLDLIKVQENFGKALSPVAIPEPAALAALLTFVASLRPRVCTK